MLGSHVLNGRGHVTILHALHCVSQKRIRTLKKIATYCKVRKTPKVFGSESIEQGPRKQLKKGRWDRAVGSTQSKKRRTESYTPILAPARPKMFQHSPSIYIVYGTSYDRHHTQYIQCAMFTCLRYLYWCACSVSVLHHVTADSRSQCCWYVLRAHSAQTERTVWQKRWLLSH